MIVYHENLQFIPCITIIGNISALIVFSCCFLLVVVPTNLYLFFPSRNPIFAYRFSGIPGLNGISELRGSLVSRDRGDRGAPGTIGLKGDKCIVGCSRGRCF